MIHLSNINYLLNTSGFRKSLLLQHCSFWNNSKDRNTSNKAYLGLKKIFDEIGFQKQEEIVSLSPITPKPTIENVLHQYKLSLKRIKAKNYINFVNFSQIFENDTLPSSQTKQTQWYLCPLIKQNVGVYFSSKGSMNTKKIYI